MVSQGRVSKVCREMASYQPRITSGRGASKKGTGGQGWKFHPYDTRCTVPGWCTYSNRGSHRAHAVREHLPAFFSDFVGETMGREMLWAARACAQLICELCTGDTGPDALDSLRNYWRAQGLPSRPVFQTTHRWARELERFCGWSSPRELNNSPANSLALLLQWDVALALVTTWDLKTQERFRSWVVPVPRPVEVGVRGSMVEREEERAGRVQGEGDSSQEQGDTEEVVLDCGVASTVVKTIESGGEQTEEQGRRNSQGRSGKGKGKKKKRAARGAGAGDAIAVTSPKREVGEKGGANTGGEEERMEVESTQEAGVEGDQEVLVIEQEGGAEEVSGGDGAASV
ncbi:hypothetical protein ElyMa_006133400 [Elysia marginata]|uniref:Uncharacterized protein n=1 Tax=Elysia marginata TaxID=1093978 RepID=A0AAV4GW82_9GAST|nr:hypothetical protein ElyMa_006133400 [Elysia marginata]